MANAASSRPDRRHVPNYLALLPKRLRPQTSIPFGALQWQTIPEFSDYEISTYGLVRRVQPGVHSRHDRVLQVLQPNFARGGDATVDLGRVSARKAVKRLLADVFLDLRSRSPGDVVRCLDGRPQLPTAWTVGWGSRADVASDLQHLQYIQRMTEPTKEDLADCAHVLNKFVGLAKGKARRFVSRARAEKLLRTDRDRDLPHVRYIWALVEHIVEDIG